jgi:hypothetical protein
MGKARGPWLFVELDWLFDFKRMIPVQGEVVMKEFVEF